MKKLFFVLITLAFIMPVTLIAGESPGTPTVENPISLAMFVDLTALAAGIVALTALIKNLLNTSGLVTDIVSWALGPILGIIGWYFKLGMFVDLLWYMALLYGLLAAFYANKGWDLLSVIRGKKDLNYKPIK
jgi:hypothetical protein